ncbi:hypothetical protein MANES_S022653v8 [Manihot esculenta]|uniref:Uncharacterized protein n=1 Tax=Manihot esculenta TaxID=3983 RepID=A0ACB7FVW4_MANES|nr:hypothetical protein MANES_S022653v8 [Manihot esculenta]
MEAIRTKSGTGCNMGDRLGSVLGWKLLGRNRAPDVTWVIDLEVFGMEAIRPKSGTGCNMGDRLGSFWDGSY